MKGFCKFELRWIIIMTAFLVLLGFSNAQAQSSTNYTLKSHVFSGGGEDMSSAHYQLRSTVGQSSAIGISSSSQHVNYGGFWYTVPWQRFIFLPLIMKQ
jgi:hypothetical protein